MIFRLYRNNDELGSTHADTIDDAFQHFMDTRAIPDNVIEKMELDDAGLTAVMQDGNVWQIRSLILSLMGWGYKESVSEIKCSACGQDAVHGHLERVDDKWYCDAHVPKDTGANRRLFWLGNRWGLKLSWRRR